MAELLPCPFCGDKPRIVTRHEQYGSLILAMAQVRCDCGASGPESYGNARVLEARRAWSRRAPAPEAAHAEPTGTLWNTPVSAAPPLPPGAKLERYDGPKREWPMPPEPKEGDGG